MCASCYGVRKIARCIYCWETWTVKYPSYTKHFAFYPVSQWLWSLHSLQSKWSAGQSLGELVTFHFTQARKLTLHWRFRVSYITTTFSFPIFPFIHSSSTIYLQSVFSFPSFILYYLSFIPLPSFTSLLIITFLHSLIPIPSCIFHPFSVPSPVSIVNLFLSLASSLPPLLVLYISMVLSLPLFVLPSHYWFSISYFLSVTSLLLTHCLTDLPNFLCLILFPLIWTTTQWKLILLNLTLPYSSWYNIAF